MKITSVIEQLDVLTALTADLKTYLNSVKSANTFAGVEGKTAGIEGALKSDHTYYGLSHAVVEDINKAKMLIANAKSLIAQSL